jgi:hypothetical protein
MDLAGPVQIILRMRQWHLLATGCMAITSYISIGNG